MAPVGSNQLMVQTPDEQTSVDSVVCGTPPSSSRMWASLWAPLYNYELGVCKIQAPFAQWIDSGESG
jgi:hypothetical protein